MTWELLHKAEDRVAAANLADHPTGCRSFSWEAARRSPAGLPGPHTRSGKVMRRLPKARELGLSEGDTSTLERGSSDGSDQR